MHAEGILLRRAYILLVVFVAAWSLIWLSSSALMRFGRADELTEQRVLLDGFPWRTRDGASFVQNDVIDLLIEAERPVAASLFSPDGMRILNVSGSQVTPIKISRSGYYRLSLSDITQDISFRTVPPCSILAYNVSNVKGYWKSNPMTRFNTWESQDCAQITLSTANWYNHLKNVTFWMMGNSHLRNLFRCTVEVMRDAALGNGRKPWWSDDGLKCSNMETTHGQDFNHIDNRMNLAGFDLWTVLWHDYQCNEAERKRPYCEKPRSYVGTRIGIDDLNKTVIPALLADRHSFLMLNLNSVFNNHTASRLMSRLKHLPPDAKQRVIFIMDPLGPSKENLFDLSSDELDILKDAIDSGITIFHLRSLFQQYVTLVQNGQLPQDSRGPGILNEHLFVPLNHVLIRLILTHILYIKGLLSSDVLKLFSSSH